MWEVERVTLKIFNNQHGMIILDCSECLLAGNIQEATTSTQRETAALMGLSRGGPAPLGLSHEHMQKSDLLIASRGYEISPNSCDRVGGGGVGWLLGVSLGDTRTCSLEQPKSRTA